MSTLTPLPRGVLQLRVSSHHHHLHHEAVPALTDHVDHLPVTDLHHILAIHLTHTHRQQQYMMECKITVPCILTNVFTA